MKRRENIERLRMLMASMQVKEDKKEIVMKVEDKEVVKDEKVEDVVEDTTYRRDRKRDRK